MARKGEGQQLLFSKYGRHCTIITNFAATDNVNRHFQDSNYATYKKMWEYMKDNEEVFTASNPEGLNRVMNENYAFLMESTSIEYIIERNCEVTQIGGLLDNKGYGIAMRKSKFTPRR